MRYTTRVIRKVIKGRITESVTDPGKPITRKQWIPKNGKIIADQVILTLK